MNCLVLVCICQHLNTGTCLATPTEGWLALSTGEISHQQWYRGGFPDTRQPLPGLVNHMAAFICLLITATSISRTSCTLPCYSHTGLRVVDYDTTIKQMNAEVSKVQQQQPQPNIADVLGASVFIRFQYRCGNSRPPCFNEAPFGTKQHTPGSIQQQITEMNANLLAKMARDLQATEENVTSQLLSLDQRAALGQAAIEDMVMDTVTQREEIASKRAREVEETCSVECVSAESCHTTPPHVCFIQLLCTRSTSTPPCRTKRITSFFARSRYSLFLCKVCWKHPHP